MMQVDLERVRANIHKASTEDLLDRATVYRDGMEADALDLIERELRERGVSWDAIAEHEHKRRQETLFDADGVALKCHKCSRPAVGESWDFHRMWGLLPVFPRRFAWCAEHRPSQDTPKPF